MIRCTERLKLLTRARATCSLASSSNFSNESDFFMISQTLAGQNMLFERLNPWFPKADLQSSARKHVKRREKNLHAVLSCLE